MRRRGAAKAGHIQDEEARPLKGQAIRHDSRVLSVVVELGFVVRLTYSIYKGEEYPSSATN